MFHVKQSTKTNLLLWITCADFSRRALSEPCPLRFKDSHLSVCDIFCLHKIIFSEHATISINRLYARNYFIKNLEGNRP